MSKARTLGKEVQRFQVSPSRDALPSHPPPPLAGCGRRSSGCCPRPTDVSATTPGSVAGSRLQQLLNGRPLTSHYPHRAPSEVGVVPAPPVEGHAPAASPSRHAELGCPLELLLRWRPAAKSGCGRGHMRSSAWAQTRVPAPGPQEISAPPGPRFSPPVSSVSLRFSSQTPPAMRISNRSPLPSHLQMSLIPGHSQPPGGSGRPLHPSLPVLDPEEGRLVLLLLPWGPDLTLTAHSCAQCGSQGLGSRASPG